MNKLKYGWMIFVLALIIHPLDHSHAETPQTYYQKFLDGIEGRSLAEVKAGSSLVLKPWVTPPSSTFVRDGLGPYFNATSCVSCHENLGRSLPTRQFMVIRLSQGQADEHGAPAPIPFYGSQLQSQAILGLSPKALLVIERKTFQFLGYELESPQYFFEQLSLGQFPSFFSFSPRVAPHMVGQGLIDQISVQSILNNEDPLDLDGDGISGRANWVWSVVNKKKMLGKFGWKGGRPSVDEQNAAAFNGDMGVGSTMFPDSEGNVEISDQLFSYATQFVKGLKAPPRLKDKSAFGEKLFKQINCQGCHVPSLDGVAAFSDFLLHDMGEELADHFEEFEATGREWRTAPLWGLGSQRIVNNHERLMHDGRARSIEEAILWHGGEASMSREKYLELSLTDKNELLLFLKSL